MTVDPAKLELAIQSKVFDPICAAAYLNFPSVKAFNVRRREHGVKGVRFGREWRYPIETLEALRKMVFGLDGPARKKA